MNSTNAIKSKMEKSDDRTEPDLRMQTLEQWTKSVKSPSASTLRRAHVRLKKPGTKVGPFYLLSKEQFMQVLEETENTILGRPQGKVKDET